MSREALSIIDLIDLTDRNLTDRTLDNKRSDCARSQGAAKLAGRNLRFPCPFREGAAWLVSGGDQIATSRAA